MDVLLLPKRSDLSSRNEVNIEREMKFKHSPYVWRGVPIIVSNMDTTGTIEMAKKLSEQSKSRFKPDINKSGSAPDVIG